MQKYYNMGLSNNIVIKLKLIVKREERGTPEATRPGESILYQLVAPLEKQNKGLWIIRPKSIKKLQTQEGKT